MSRSAATFAEEAALHVCNLADSCHGTGARRGGLALGELRCFASALEAVLLALFLARITSEQTGLLQGTARLDIGVDQGPGDSVRDGTGLSRNSAAVNFDRRCEAAHH